MRKSPKTVGRISVSVTRQTAPESTADVGLRCANPTYVLEAAIKANLRGLGYGG
ncbi:MAG: hypothetical protein Q8O37_15360 [Sulfuricellaceae bacterium]|nr:hypothetical protein [Sulfuricellaceae bacterium]